MPPWPPCTFCGRGLSPPLSSKKRLRQLRDVVLLAQGDQLVPAFDDIAGHGVEDHLARILFHRHDDEPVALPDPGLFEGFPDDGRPLSDGQFIHPKLQALAARCDLDEVEHGGPQDGHRHSVSTQRIGRDDPIGARPQQASLRLLLLRTREDPDVGVQLLGRQNHVEVLGIGGQHADDPLGAPDPGLDQALVMRGISQEVDKTLFLEPLDHSRPIVHNNAGHLLRGKFPGDKHADPAAAADDVVVAHFLDGILHLASPHDIHQPAFHHGLRHETHCEEHRADPDGHERHREDHARAALRREVPVADGGQGHDRHVHGLQQAPPLDGVKPHRADRDEGRDDDERGFQVVGHPVIFPVAFSLALFIRQVAGIEAFSRLTPIIR